MFDLVCVVFYFYVNILLPVALTGISFLSEEFASQYTTLVVKVGDGSEETRFRCPVVGVIGPLGKRLCYKERKHHKLLFLVE